MLDQFFFTYVYLCRAIYDTKETEELSTVLFILSINAFLSADFLHRPCLNSNPFLNFPQDFTVINMDYCGLYWGSFTILHRYYVNFVQSFIFRPVKRNNEKLLKNIWCRKKTPVFTSGRMKLRVRLSNLRCWWVRWSELIGMSLPSSLRSSEAQATIHVNIALNK